MKHKRLTSMSELPIFKNTRLQYVLPSNYNLGINTDYKFFMAERLLSSVGHNMSKYFYCVPLKTNFVPVAVETAGPRCSEAGDFFKELGCRLKD